MTETKKYDVLIVGGGPAGSTAGYLLSNAGLKVLIIDKSRFPRPKLCGGCITEKTIRLLKRVFGETVSGLKKNDIISFESNQYEIYFKNKQVTKKDLPLAFYFVDRYRYDHFLLTKAGQAGAEILEGERCTSLDISGSSATTSTGRTIQAKLIIGADGINSIVRRSFPKGHFDQQNWLDNMAIAFEIFVDRSQVRKQIDHPVLYFDFVSHGYSWIFPNKDKLIIGAGGPFRKNKKQLLPAFNNFLSGLDIRDLQTDEIKASAFPYGGFLLQPAFRNTLLAGDAAGFADPLLGEGIFYAQRSAELASQAILKALSEGKDVEHEAAHIAGQYIGSLQRYIYPEFVYARKTRDFIFTCMNKFHPAPLKIIMDLLGTKPAEAIHGLRSYKWMKMNADFH
ncbi:MAG: NAD(P)/FAD-dependent oxidoreductase [Nitrospirae bacterium]|nr:NAD(P)/FAD-dependent oxidoreductase [Nitrospirota bacterium]